MIALSLLISLLTGFLLVRALWPGGARWEAADWLRLPLGALAGLGVSSLAGFAVQVVDPSNRGLWIGADLALFAAAACACALLGRKAAAGLDDGFDAAWPPAKWAGLAAVGVMVVAYALMALPRQTGDVDAWSIWNMRARFLYRGGSFGLLADPLLRFTHPEFPYLLSALALRSWHWAAEETMAGPAAIAATFVAALTMAMHGALRVLRSPSQGFLALAALLGSAGFIGNGAVQYADFPLAAFLFASLAALAAAERFNAPRIAAIAGLCAGFAAWTKFEGVFYAAALAGLAFWRMRGGGLAAFVCGAAPGLAMLAYFRAAIAPPATAPLHASPVLLLIAVGSKLFTFSLLSWVVTPLLVIALYLYCVGLTDRRSTWISLAALFAAGCAAMMVRDDNIGDAAAIRIILHLWPAALLAAFLHAKTPEELGGKPAKSRK